jgi:3-hydroxybutyryl-CoA dehydrogenase
MRDTVVIVGSGLMGSGIAARSALAGNTTRIVNPHLDHAQAGVSQAIAHLKELGDEGLAAPDAVTAAAGRISCSGDLTEAAQNARLIIEAITEKLDRKQTLFADLDALTPSGEKVSDTIPLVSTTSGFRISDIAAKMTHPDRAVTGHFWFPAYLVPLVEVVVCERGDRTKALAVAQMVYDEFLRWGKEPVLIKKDLVGQLGNRLQHAMFREALNLVAMGAVTPEDVDRAVKNGFGIRMPVWGPLEHCDAVGLDLSLEVQDTVLPALDNAPRAGDFLRNLVNSGSFGYKTGKGLYDWSVKDMQALQKQRDEFIVAALKLRG